MTINSATTGSDWFLNGLAKLQRQQEKTQRDLSSGYRIHDAADAPEQTPKLIALSSRLAAFEDWQSSLVEVGAEALAGDQAIGTAVSLVENARSLAVRATSPTLSAADRQSIATEVAGLQQQLLTIANTTVQGRYIFGGDRDDVAPFQINPASPIGVSAATVQNATRVVKGPDGDVVFQSLTASEILNASGGASAFGAIESLRAALVAGSQSGVGSALQSLQSVSALLNRQQGVYGAAGQRIANVKTAASNEIVSLRSSISEIRDTDVAQAAIDLTRQSTAQQAAIAAQAQIPRKTLFDYLG